MRLRSQLLLVSLLALLLPWAGCSYVNEMENALRTGQQESLLAVTRSVAALFEGRDDLATELTERPIVTGAADLFLETEGRGLNVDGYPDDGLDLTARSALFQEAANLADSRPLRLMVYLEAIGDRAYLLAEVRDAQLSLRNEAGGAVIGSDHLELAMGEGQVIRRLWISPQAPGELTGLVSRDGRLVSEPRMRGVWVDTNDGYRIEMSFPRAWLGSHFGLVARDGADPARFAGSFRPGEMPGWLYRRSDALERELTLLANDNLRLSVVNRAGWLRGMRGSLAGRAPEQIVPGAWLLEALYRRTASEETDDATYRGADAGKLSRGEVALATGGQPQARWYAAVEGEEVAIVSAAVPIFVGPTEPGGQAAIGAVIAEQSSAGILSLTNAALVRLAIVSSLLLIVIVAGLLGYASWLSWRISRLSRDVLAVMQPDGRELGRFRAGPARDEVGMLGRSFEQLLERLRSFTDYLQTLGSKLSHELRTPLAVVTSSLDNLETEELTPLAREYLQRARGGSERLSHILSALSEASRIEQSIQASTKKTVDLTALVREVVAGYRSAYPQRRIEGDLPAAAVQVAGCPELLAQLMDKLMDNANDFCLAGGVIRFVLRVEGESALLEVENDGPGLPDDGERLFESLVSVREGRSEKVHLGLGLTIVRLIAEFHGGRVTAANRPGGGGVAVAVRIPMTDGR